MARRTPVEPSTETSLPVADAASDVPGGYLVDDEWLEPADVLAAPMASAWMCSWWRGRGSFPAATSSIW
jgi:hypothetical protein